MAYGSNMPPSSASPPTTVDEEFCRQLPKVELHAHLTGSISRSCLHEIWIQACDSSDTSATKLKLQDPLEAMPADKVDYDLETFFPLFSSYIYQLCDTIASIQYSTRDVLRSFQEDGVIYLELRTTPRAIPQNNITKAQYIDTVLGVIAEHNANTVNSLQAALILSIDRRNTAEQAVEVVDLAIQRIKRGVVGLDLCGDPTKGDVHTFASAFAKARNAGLGLTVHFAEAQASGSEEELQELLSWQPHRLGHVIHVPNHLREVIIKHNMALELCLSCNVHARMIVGGYPDHHFGWWRGRGVPLCLCTDDVGVFCSPMSQEFWLAAQHFDLSREDLRDLSIAAAQSSFANEGTKVRLVQRVKDHA